MHVRRFKTALACKALLYTWLLAPENTGSVKANGVRRNGHLLENYITNDKEKRLSEQLCKVKNTSSVHLKTFFLLLISKS